MALVSFPFDSKEGDRIYKSKHFADYFKSLFSNGLGLDENGNFGLKVTAKGSEVEVSSGTIMINGRYMLNDSIYVLKQNLPHGMHPRIDAVVARLDLSLNTRDISLYIKPGTAGTGKPPALIRNGSVWEMCLAELEYTSTELKKVVDTREDRIKCGICMAALMSFYTKEW